MHPRSLAASADANVAWCPRVGRLVQHCNAAPGMGTWMGHFRLARVRVSIGGRAAALLATRLGRFAQRTR